MAKIKPRPLPVLNGEETRRVREQLRSAPTAKEIASHERAVALIRKYIRE